MMPFVYSAILLFQDSDTGVPPAPANVHSGLGGLLDVIHNIGPVAFVVLGILALSSLYSWAIILAKWSRFRRARTQSRRFLRAFRKADRLQEVSAVSEQFKPSPLVPVFDEVYDAYRRQTGGFGPPRNVTSLERAAQSAAGESLAVLEEKLTWLATIGAISPFIGLFGTVMGIIDAFHGLGTEGAATLRAVAPGVSEALVTTAAGLAVAIPAVIAYNQFAASLREFAAHLDDFSREMINSLEEISSQPAQVPMEREAARGLHH
jgi:biopolymer transport protein TolQ